MTDLKHNKYVTSPEFNKITAENFAPRLALANLIKRTDFDAKLSSLDRKLLQLKLNIYLSKIN